MNTKLTYKIRELITKHDYTEIIIKHHSKNEEVRIHQANVRLRYVKKENKAYLCFGNHDQCVVSEVEDESIHEVVVNDELLMIETVEKTYYCYKNTEKLYY